MLKAFISKNSLVQLAQPKAIESHSTFVFPFVIQLLTQIILHTNAAVLWHAMPAYKMLVPDPQDFQKEKIKIFCNSFPEGLMKKPHLILLPKFTGTPTSAQ